MVRLPLSLRSPAGTATTPVNCPCRKLTKPAASFIGPRVSVAIASHLYQNPPERNRTLVLHHIDLDEGLTLAKILGNTRPDEGYKLATQSQIRVSFDDPFYTVHVTRDHS